jgi:hypothetical protein
MSDRALERVRLQLMRAETKGQALTVVSTYDLALVLRVLETQPENSTDEHRGHQQQ